MWFFDMLAFCIYKLTFNLDFSSQEIETATDCSSLNFKESVPIIFLKVSEKDYYYYH